MARRVTWFVLTDFPVQEAAEHLSLDEAKDIIREAIAGKQFDPNFDQSLLLRATSALKEESLSHEVAAALVEEIKLEAALMDGPYPPCPDRRHDSSTDLTWGADVCCRLALHRGPRVSRQHRRRRCVRQHVQILEPRNFVRDSGNRAQHFLCRKKPGASIPRAARAVSTNV